MSRIAMIKAAKAFLEVGSFDDPSSIRLMELVSYNGDWVYGKLPGTPYSMPFNLDFCWPVEAKKQLVEICTERQKLKKAFDDSMSLVYQLRNKIARGEIT